MSEKKEVEFIEVNADATISEMTADFEAEMGRKLYPADPWRAVILFMANIVLHQQVAFNEKFKMNIPGLAKGKYLDYLSDFFNGIERLGEGAAVTTMEFEISEVQETYVDILKGTEVTVGELVFSTVENCNVAPGNLTAQVIAVCNTKGTIGNGFLPGQISTIVKPFYLYKSCKNLTETSGGTDVETDQRYYERMIEANESYSTAGPDGAYIYHAMSVSSDIKQVKPISPSRGNVEVYILLNGGNIPGQELLDKVETELSAKSVRPLTDFVKVLAPQVVNFDIDLKYFINESDASTETDVKAAIEQAVENYKLWQRERMGRDINGGYLLHLLYKAGAKRAEIKSPGFTPVDENCIGIAENINVVYGGLESD